MDDFSDGGEQEAQRVIGALMALYNELTRQVQEADVALLPGCYFHEDPLANFNANAPVRQWCLGFVNGRHWLEDSWNAYVPGALEEEFNAQFMVLSYFASKAMAEEFLLESRKPDATLAQTSAGMQKLFPESMSAFAHPGSTIQKVLLQNANQPVRSEKIGRNEPCLCGSGKKYKKCCALKLH